MRTDELIRSFEVRGERRGGEAAERVVADAGRAAVRRHRAQRALAGGAVAVVLVASGLVAWQALDGPDRPVQVATAPDQSVREWAELEAAADQLREGRSIPLLQSQEVHNRVGVLVRDGWHSSGENLTPAAPDSEVVASAGTAALVAGDEACPGVPVAAVAAMGDDDALVVVHEHTDPVGDAPPEAGGESLWEMRGPRNDVDAMSCPSWPAGYDAWQVDFQMDFPNQNRVLSVLIVVGSEVTVDRFVELATVVDTIAVLYPSLSTLGPPPIILQHTGLPGYPVTVDGRDYLVAVEHEDDRMRLEVADLEQDQSVVAMSGPASGTTASSRGVCVGTAPSGTETVEASVGGPSISTHPFVMDAAPDLLLWIVHDPEVGEPASGDSSGVPMNALSCSVAFLDAEGNQLDW